MLSAYFALSACRNRDPLSKPINRHFFDAAAVLKRKQYFSELIIRDYHEACRREQTFTQPPRSSSIALRPMRFATS